MCRVENYGKCCRLNRQAGTVGAVLQDLAAMWGGGRRGGCWWARGAMGGVEDGDGRGSSKLARERC